MSRKQELIDLLLVRGTSASRERLELESTENLEKILDNSLLNEIHVEAMNSPEVVKRMQRLDDINEQSRRDHEEFQLSLIFRTPINGKVVIDNFAARKIIRSWVDEAKGDTGISVQWFLKRLKDTPSLARSLQWQSADVLDPVKRNEAESAQAEADRETFNLFCRENGFSKVDANFRLALEVLEPGFSRYALAQAVQSNALQLAPAPPEELAQFRQDAAEERQDFLINRATPLELRQAARQESEQGRSQQQRTAQQIKIRESKESSLGYVGLPETDRDGIKIDRAYLLRLADNDITRYKQFCSRYGFAAITTRINQVG